MDAENPFAPPKAEDDGGGSGDLGGYWVEGDVLVISKDGPVLPDRCVKCNAPATERFDKQLQWVPRWVPLTILICWPAYFAAFFMTRKTAKVDVGLCDEHARRRRLFNILGGTALVVALIAIFGGVMAEALAALAVGLIGVFAAIFLLLPAVVLRPTRIDEENGYYKGADRAFLDSLG